MNEETPAIVLVVMIDHLFVMVVMFKRMDHLHQRINDLHCHIQVFITDRNSQDGEKKNGHKKWWEAN